MKNAFEQVKATLEIEGLKLTAEDEKSHKSSCYWIDDT